jgi:hypothetical protein
MVWLPLFIQGWLPVLGSKRSLLFVFVLASHFFGSGSGSKRTLEVGSIRQHEGQALLPGLEEGGSDCWKQGST